MIISIWEKWIAKKYSIFSDKMQTFHEISANFHNDWKCHESVSVYLVEVAKCQSL